MAENPRIDVELKERQSTDIARAISRGFVEIGILSDAVETTGLELVPFARDQLVLITARDHPLAEHKRVSFSDILQEQFIGLSAGALQEHVEIQATRLGGRIKIRTKLRTFEGVGNMVAASVGIAIIPQAAARRLRNTLPIATISISDAWAKRNLVIAVQSIAELTAPAGEPRRSPRLECRTSRNQNCKSLASIRKDLQDDTPAHNENMTSELPRLW